MAKKCIEGREDIVNAIDSLIRDFFERSLLKKLKR
jgi:hypothetical protein